MNKPYNQNDEERDQSRRLDREQADKQKSREQSGKAGVSQQQAEHETRRPKSGTSADDNSHPAKEK